MDIIKLSDQEIADKIYLIRNQKVMLDSDLAELYGVETKVLNQAVNRNSDKFPKDFMFEIDESEWQILKSQIVTSSWGGRRKLPKVFTEHGVLMLSSVLNSKRANAVNIQIIKLFVRLREMLFDNTDLRLEIEKIKSKLENHDKNMEIVFRYLDELLEAKYNPQPREPIGFKLKKQ